MTTHPTSPSTGERRRQERAAVVRGLLHREVTGASLRANTVKREQHELFVAAIRAYRTWGRALAAAGLDGEKVSCRRTWSVPRVLQEIQALARQGAALNAAAIRRWDHSLLQAARKRLGSWDQALQFAGVDPSSVRRQHRPWTKSEIIAAIQQQAPASGRRPLVWSQLQPVGARLAIHRLFGSWAAAVRAAGLIYQPREYPRWSRARVVAAIRRRRAAGASLACTAVIASQPTLYDAARRYCGGWNKALSAAGLDPLQIRRRIVPWTPPTVLAELRRRAKQGGSGGRAVALSYLRPISLIEACVRFFGSFEAAARAAGVQAANIAWRRNPYRSRARGGDQTAGSSRRRLGIGRHSCVQGKESDHAAAP